MNNKPEMEIIEYLNLRCPYCRQWFNDSRELLDIPNIHRTIKLLNIDKPGLIKGNKMHEYVPNDESRLDVIDKIFQSQDEWSGLEAVDDISNYAENVLGLTNQKNLDVLDQTVLEAQKHDIKTVPSIIIGEYVFDQKISQQDLQNIITGQE